MQTKPIIEYIKDGKVSINDIERCVDKAKVDILRQSGSFINDGEIFKIIDKWLSVKKDSVEIYK